LQPVVGRKLKDGTNRLQLIAGFTRVNAARLIREGYIYTDVDGTEKEYKDPNFQIQVRLWEGSDAEALRANIVENNERNNTSPIDDAHNHRKLREQYGYSDTDIQRLYNYASVASVTRLRGLLSLDEKIQSLVHEGVMSVDGALASLKLDAKERNKVVRDATKANGKVNTATIKAAVRDKIINDANKPTDADASANGIPDPVSTPRRSMKEVRAFFADMTSEANGEKVSGLATAIIRFINGEIQAKDCEKAISKVCK
jgi:ParB-like chromosome segregation protein Spo0J